MCMVVRTLDVETKSDLTRNVHVILWLIQSKILEIRSSLGNYVLLHARLD